VRQRLDELEQDRLSQPLRRAYGWLRPQVKAVNDPERRAPGPRRRAHRRLFRRRINRVTRGREIVNADGSGTASPLRLRRGRLFLVAAVNKIVRIAAQFERLRTSAAVQSPGLA